MRGVHNKLGYDNRHHSVTRDLELLDAHGFRVRCVSGNRVLHPKLGRLPIGADGFCRVTITKLAGLIDLVRFWDCPVTFCPPGDTEDTAFWCIELEDGLRPPANAVSYEDAGDL